MKTLFAGDTPYNRVMTKVFDAVLVSVLTLMCCLPVVTAGAALTAACGMYMKMAKDREGAILPSYLAAFRANLKESIGGWILLLAGLVWIIADLCLSRQYGIGYGMMIVLAALYGVYAVWYFCLRARFQETTGSALVNSLKFCIAFLPLSLGLCLYLAALLVLLLWQPMLFALQLFLAVAGALYLPSVLIGKKMDKYIEESNV